MGEFSPDASEEELGMAMTGQVAPAGTSSTAGAPA
jgi:hypothetical protein